jgi:tetratricopeptide (TPR) repeat protein
MKNYIEAVKYLERANNFYEDNMDVPPVYYELAEAYFYCGKINDALIINDLAIEKDSDYSWNYIQRGILLSQDGNKDSLFDNYKVAIQKDPNEIEFHGKLINRLIEMGYFDDAYAQCVQLLEKNKRYYWCYTYMGYIFMLQRDFVKSLNLFEKAYDKDETDKLTLKLLSFYCFFTGDNNKAWDFDVLFSSQADLDIPLFETRDEYISKYESDQQFKLLKEKLSIEKQ